MMPYAPPPVRHPQKPVEVSIDAAINGGQAAVGIIVFAFIGFFAAIFAFYWLVQLVNYMMAADTIQYLFYGLGAVILMCAITGLYESFKKPTTRELIEDKGGAT